MTTAVLRTPDRCPVGCGRVVRPGELLCGPCWFKVPLPLRREVWHTWRRWQRGGLDSDWRRYAEARDAAIASVP